ncbi:hypothetical protein SAMN05216215_102515 [Saccharopolyspora shandongensis]|uniref:Uncharacterized protein n=1 Tax=Saccharopolyspora shandongensis TaxID=418495 RepID=A0A1H3J5Z5_9PSEU|nr:hypothetical protein SAMN05216215_102515 [Saccharopolyspora shandongensis]
MSDGDDTDRRLPEHRVSRGMNGRPYLALFGGPGYVEVDI